MKTLESKWQVLIIICSGIFISSLDGSIVNIANPSIAADLGVAMQQVQWVVTAYMLVITSTLLLFGYLGDFKGSHRIFRFGFLLFSLGSLGCSLSPVLTSLILSRILQALGASMMMATGIGIVSNTFPAGERGKALGLTGSVVALGNMTGPPLGGFLLAHGPWPIIFLINVPIGLVAFLLAFKYLTPAEIRSGQTDFDFPGAFLLAISSMLLVLSFTSRTGVNLWLLLPGLLLGFGFYRFEKKRAAGLLDLTLFKVKRFSLGNIMGFITYITQPAVTFLLPFYLQDLRHFTTTRAGLIMSIMPVTMAFIAPLAGSLSDRIGSSRLMPVSFFLLVAANLSIAYFTAQTPLAVIAATLVVFGAGTGLFGSPNNSSILGSVPREKAGYTGGFSATIRNFGYAMGTAAAAGIFTLILNTNLPARPYALAYAAGMRGVYLTAALVNLAGLLIALSMMNDPSSTKLDTGFDHN